MLGTLMSTTFSVLVLVLADFEMKVLGLVLAHKAKVLALAEYFTSTLWVLCNFYISVIIAEVVTTYTFLERGNMDVPEDALKYKIKS